MNTELRVAQLKSSQIGKYNKAKNCEPHNVSYLDSNQMHKCHVKVKKNIQVKGMCTAYM